MKRPLTGLVIAYAAGIWVGSLADWPVAWALAASAGLLALFLFWRRVPVLLMAVGCAGLLSYRETISLSSPQDISRLIQRDRGAWLRGVIVSPPEEITTNRWSFRLRLAAARRDGDWEPASGTVWMGTLEPSLRYGDEIECAAVLRAPETARNPGEFDWRDWLARQGIAFVATVESNAPCAVLARGRGNRLTAAALGLRERFERALACGLEDAPAMAGVLTGMVIGKRSDIPTETYADFQRTGVFHVFAINGLHVGLVTGVLLLILRAARVPVRWTGAAAVPLLVLYVWATGAHPGAVRALVMAGVWLTGRMLLRPADGLNNLAVAALILLVWQPLELFDGGFLLSFTVVAAIVVLTPRIEARLRPLLAVDQLLPRHLVPRWRRALDEVWGWSIRLLSCSVAAWVGLIPLLAAYFHLFTPVSIVANLLVIPLLSGVIGLGLAATLAHAVWPWLAAMLNNANYLLLTVMTGGVEWLGRVPFSHWYVQAPPVWLTVGYYALGVVLVARKIPWRGWCLAVGTPVLVGAALVTAWPDEAVEVTVLHLSDGAAIFVNQPGERDDWLIDGGGDAEARVVLPFLRAQGVDRLGGVAVSCKDKAHVAGLSNVVVEVPVGRVIMSDMPGRSPTYRQWREAVKARGLPVEWLHAGEKWSAGAVKFTALNPPVETAATRSDDNALVLALECGPTRLLLLSDAGATVERRLVGELAGRFAVMVKGGHGRELSGTAELLAATRPEVVVQMVNEWSNRRAPDADLAGRVQTAGGRLLRMDETGAVTIRLTHRGYSVRTCLPAQ